MLVNLTPKLPSAAHRARVLQNFLRTQSIRSIRPFSAAALQENEDSVETESPRVNPLARFNANFANSAPAASKQTNISSFANVRDSSQVAPSVVKSQEFNTFKAQLRLSDVTAQKADSEGYVPREFILQWKLPEYMSGATPIDRMVFSLFFLDNMAPLSISQTMGSHIWTVIKSIFSAIRRSPDPHALLKERRSVFGLSEERHKMITSALETAYNDMINSQVSDAELQSKKSFISSRDIRLNLNANLPATDELGNPTQKFSVEEIMVSRFIWEIESGRSNSSKLVDLRLSRFGKSFDYSANAPLWNQNWPYEEWLHSGRLLPHHKLAWAYFAYEKLSLRDVTFAIGGMLDETSSAILNVFQAYPDPKEFITSYWNALEIEPSKMQAVQEIINNKFNIEERRLAPLMKLITTEHGEGFVTYNELRLIKFRNEVERGLYAAELNEDKITFSQRYLDQFPKTKFFSMLPNVSKLLWAEFAYDHSTFSQIARKYRLNRYDLARALDSAIWAHEKPLVVLMSHWQKLELDDSKAHQIYAVLQEAGDARKTLRALLDEIDSRAKADGLMPANGKRFVTYENLIFERTRFKLEMREAKEEN